ncbi:MAG: hypothetical protein ACRC9I_01865 [Acinetobacter sp.]
MTALDVEKGEMDAEVCSNQGDRWSFVAVLPESGFIHTVHSGAHTLVEAQVFVGKIKEQSDQSAPLFHSDGWFYEQALRDNYCQYVPKPYSGRGRRPHPVQVIDPELRYVQVRKTRNSQGKIEDISTHIVLGDEGHVLNTFIDAKRCKTVNTDFVESRNGKYRKDNARLIRKTLCHSKKAVYHDAHILFLTQVFNYTRPNPALKKVLHPTAKRFQTKYQHVTPAMAENIVDKCFSLKELLFIRPLPIT